MAIKNKKSIWGVHALGIVLWTACFFFGLAYHSSYVLSIPVSILVAGLMFILVRGITRQKAARTHSGNDKILDFSYKVFYTVTIIASFFFVTHFMHIIMVESDIRNNANQQYEELKNMLSDEHENSYKRWSDNRLAVYLKSLVGTMSSDDIVTRMEIKEAEFTESLGSVRDFFETSSFSKNRNLLENWIWYDLRAVNVFNDLYAVKKECESRLLDASREIDYAQETYNPNPLYVINLTDSLKLNIDSWNSVTVTYSILLTLVMQLLILLIIFVTERGDKQFKGKKIDGVGSLHFD